MPATRQLSLRERRRVGLLVNTDISPDVDFCPPSRRVKAPGLGRGRSQTRKAVGIAPSVTTRNPSVPDPFSIKNLHSYHGLIPYLSLGLYDSKLTAESFKLQANGKFTHIIQLQCLNDATTGSSCRLINDPVSNTHLLKLNIHTENPSLSKNSNNPFCLNLEQFLIARDFLSLALPYSTDGQARMNWVHPTPNDRVHVLITAPIPSNSNNRTALALWDTMGIITSYLAFVTASDYNYVLNCLQDAADDFPEVWRDGLDTLADQTEAEAFIEELLRA